MQYTSFHLREYDYGKDLHHSFCKSFQVISVKEETENLTQ
jgi:hypothetical protein